MRITFTKKALKQYARLPLPIKKKADKQFTFVVKNFEHPSLQVKKMKGSSFYEARVDYHYRFTFNIEGSEIFILTIGMHDEGLGQK